LQSAGTSGTWGNSYVYDAWGNLNEKNVTIGSGESWTNVADGNNHLLYPYGYDNAGNLTTLYGTPYNKFNAENQWVNQSTYGVSYLYDGDGHRVKASGGASGTRVYIYDMAGRVIEEVDQNGNLLNQYTFLAGC
jgi:hypothetical protein